MSREQVQIRISQNDLGQLREGIEARRDFYRRSAKHYREGNTPGDDVLHDRAKAEEHDRTADHYTKILNTIDYQVEQRAKRVRVAGSHGTLTVDGYGYVVDYQPEDQGEYSDVIRCIPPVDALYTGHTDILFCWLETDQGEIIPPEVGHYLMVTGRHSDHPDQHKPIKPTREQELEAVLRNTLEYLETNRPNGDVREIFSELNMHENGIIKPIRAILGD